MIGKQTPVLEYWEKIYKKYKGSDPAKANYACGCLDSIRNDDMWIRGGFVTQSYLKGFNRYKRKEEKNG